jgi:hypothetical protein
VAKSGHKLAMDKKSRPRCFLITIYGILSGKDNVIARRVHANTANRSTKEIVAITKERISVILLTHENIESMSPTLRFFNVRYGALLVRVACLLVTSVVALFCSSQHSLGAEHDWYQCPVGKTKHLDLNKISLIRDSVVRPNLHTLRFYSFGSHFLLGASASGFSNEMLSQLEALLLQKRNWVRVSGSDLTMFVNLDYVVGYSSVSDGGYILVLTTGEDVIVPARDDGANAKIKEFAFP